ncbi:MAG: winged helix-turn-helix transcriptional regulator [Nitrososphaerota archaeon]|nr:winged helix-turn-helix transcriptional regulator [Nitrososphaerota archaeon]
MSKKGFYPLLLYINERGQVGYNDTLKHALANKIVDSRSTVTVVLNTLTDMKIVDRTVSADRPIRTTYRLSKKGRNILPMLRQIQREFE